MRTSFESPFTMPTVADLFAMARDAVRRARYFVVMGDARQAAVMLGDAMRFRSTAKRVRKAGIR